MFHAFQDFLDVFTPLAGPAHASNAPTLRLAAAVLLVEVMRASDGISAQERAAAARFLAERFQLREDALAPLLQQAEQASAAAYDYFRFTQPLDESLSPEAKIALVQAMWKVAYADGQLAPPENTVISKVADLLHVSHGDYIAAKMRACAPG